MELLKILSKTFNTLFPFADFLYLLQQEEYSFQRIWFWLPRFFLRRNFQNREKLVYTKRAKVTLVLAVLVFVTLIFLGYLWVGLTIGLLAVIFLSAPLAVLFSNAVLNPFFYFLKRRVIRKAGLYFKNIRGNTKVIAITGSYGKTTVKNFIEQFVKFSYKTQMIPGNINSTIGIADWILNNFQKGTEVLIVEMDSYTPKGISESTKLTAPDIAIITNVGDQHLQRYTTKDKLAQSLVELFEFSPQSTIKITDSGTLSYLKKRKFDTKNIITAKEGQQVSFASISHSQNLQYALLIADILKIPLEYVEHISKNLVVPERRQSRKQVFGFDGIDDSYNISFTTASAGVVEAFNQSKKYNKKLLVITAGIPELGPLEQDKNKELGSLLNQKADKVFILKSIYAKEIISGIAHVEKICNFRSFNEAIRDLQKEYNPREWFVLVQPELTDLYY